VSLDSERHHRRSIRLKGYDYTQPGAYFVTICTQDRACLFGEVVNGEMRRNAAGQMVLEVWNELPRYYRGVDIDAFVVMPNHVHGIIILVGAGPCACPGPRACPGMGQPQGVAPTSLLHHYPPIWGNHAIWGNHRGVPLQPSIIRGNHGGLPLRCRCRMWCTGSKQ